MLLALWKSCMTGGKIWTVSNLQTIFETYFWGLQIILFVDLNNRFKQSKESNPWDWGQLVSNWEQKISYTKSQQILCRKRISMLAGLKVSSWTCKHVFYRPGHNAKGTQFWRFLNAKIKYTIRCSSKSRWEKLDYLSSHYICSQSYGH